MVIGYGKPTVVLMFECITDNWTLEVGDPHLRGWLIAIGYFLTAILACIVMKQAGEIYKNSAKARVFWLGLILFLIFLGLNKQLDLQTLFSTVFKCHSQFEGWYDQRRHFQSIFVVVMAALFSIILGFIAWVLRENLRKDRLAILGLIFILVFIFIHAAYFHHFDFPFTIIIYETGMGSALEIIGICLICLQLLLHLSGRKQQKISQNQKPI